MTIIGLQYGRSPLYQASYDGHLQVVKTLTAAGANVNKANKVGTLNVLCNNTYVH